MKKNIVSIVILALSVANLVLSALLIFTFMPQAKKTDKLVTEICSVLKIELDSSGVKDKVELKNLEYCSLEDKINISIVDSENTVHYAQVSATLTLNKTSTDYATFNEKMQSGIDSVIYDEVRTVISGYTFEQIGSHKYDDEIQNKIRDSLNDKFDTTCIYEVSFRDFIIQ